MKLFVKSVFRHGYVLAALILLGMFSAGCVTSSLDQSRRDMKFSKPALPVFLGVLSLEDPVPADDSGVYLRDYLMRHRAVTSVELLPTTQNGKQFDADYVLSGTITVPERVEERMGWGTFFSVISLGGYNLLGGPTKRTAMTVVYDFSLFHPATGKTIPLRFKDERKGCYGLYGPKAAKHPKPGVYEPGWREIYFRLKDRACSIP